MNPSSTIHRMDVSELEQRCRAGDPAAATELFTRARPELVRFCYRYLGNADDAEDAVQDVAAALASSGLPATSVRAWLFRVARNRCFNLCRERRGGRMGAGTFFAESRFQSPRTGPRTALDRGEQNAHLRAHLASLPPEQAEVLTLRYMEGLSRKEVADVLQLPESVVKSRLFHGARELRRRTSGRGPEAP